MVWASFFFLVSVFAPSFLFLFLCSFLAVQHGEGCGWWVRWLVHPRSSHNQLLCDVTLLPDGRIVWLKLLQSSTSVPGVLVSKFPEFLTIYSTDFIYIVACVNLLTSFWICWCSSLLKLIPLAQTLNLCLCLWDSIANQFRHTPANRTGYDHTEIIYFSIICCVRHPHLAFRNTNLHKTRSVSQNQPIWKHPHLHLLSSKR